MSTLQYVDYNISDVMLKIMCTFIENITWMSSSIESEIICLMKEILKEVLRVHSSVTNMQEAGREVRKFLALCWGDM